MTDQPTECGCGAYGCADEIVHARVGTPVPAFGVLTAADHARAKERFGVIPGSHAVRMLDAGVSEPEWLDARRTGIGASEIASVLGVPGAFGSPFSVWWAKKLGWDTDETESMEIGTLLEPVVGTLIERRRPDLMVFRARGALYRHPNMPWMLASPDYLSLSNEVARPAPGDDPTAKWLVARLRPIEVKTDEGGKAWGQPGTAEVPERVKLQVLQQCAVFGSDMGYVARLAGKRFTWYRVPWEPDTYDRMVVAGMAFTDSLAGDVPPPLDGHDATEDALKRLHPGEPIEDTTATIPLELALRYLSAHHTVKNAKATIAEAENNIREILGVADAEYAVTADGKKIAQHRVYKRSGYPVAPTMVDGIWKVGK